MKTLIVVGSTGVIGKEIVKLLRSDYNIIEINRHSGDYQLDIQNAEAVEEAFRKIGSFDALISAGGYGKWGSLEEHSLQDFHDGLNSKLMGQVNLFMIGRKYARPDAVFLLTTGVLAHRHRVGSLSLGMINMALEYFAQGVALELTGDIKINIVSPEFTTETLAQMGEDTSTGIPAREAALLYKRALEEGKTGEIYKGWKE
ncbi:short chain dehydrogenase [Fulvitalea axinellae]|uniref:Short chain dehydrogenase n=1 Tax=Fulvitalea axinellae TaxID=1182444 RepID=A0AAU9DEF7_9BACT|nr:short chain dehydrogenase [Fulvitalea axinellae]